MKILLIFIVLTGGLGAWAGEEACSIDAEKFCSGFTPGGTQVHKCLKDHVHELSPDCKDFQAAKGKEGFRSSKKAVKKDDKGKLAPKAK